MTIESGHVLVKFQCDSAQIITLTLILRDVLRVPESFSHTQIGRNKRDTAQDTALHNNIHSTKKAHQRSQNYAEKG